MENQEAITMDANTATDIVIAPLKDFCEAQGFTQIIPQVRVNVNKYPYLTFIDGENSATNVYFSKAEAEKRTKDEILDKDTLRSLQVVQATNAEGEVRHKLTTGNSSRIDLSDLF